MFSGRKKYKIQGYTRSHKKALVKSQVIELLRAGRIKTTPPKARLLKREFDRIVTAYKKGTTSSHQKVRSLLGENVRAFERLGDVIDEKLSDRNSGYTRLIKTLPRKGDNAEQVYVILVNTEYSEKKSKLREALEKREIKKKLSKNKSVEAVKEERNTGRQTVNKVADKRRNSK